MPVANCLSVSHMPGDFFLVQGVKQNQRDSYDSEKSFRNRGTGWGEARFHASLLLITDLGKFELAPFFREKFAKPGSRFAKLTPDRVKRIQRSMPKQINLIPNSAGKLEPDPAELDKWFQRL